MLRYNFLNNTQIYQGLKVIRLKVHHHHSPYNVEGGMFLCNNGHLVLSSFVLFTSL